MFFRGLVLLLIGEIVSFTVPTSALGQSSVTYPNPYLFRQPSGVVHPLQEQYQMDRILQQQRQNQRLQEKQLFETIRSQRQQMNQQRRQQDQRDWQELELQLRQIQEQLR